MKDKLTQLITEWDKKSIFPENMAFIQNLTDNLYLQVPHVDCKILVYIDYTRCANFKLQLYQWKRFIYVDSISDHPIPFLFFIHPKDQIEINSLICRGKFDYPVCLDHENKLYTLNKFPDDSLFHIFLLDQDNRVRVLGNPLHKSSIKELYLKEIKGKVQVERTIVTMTEVDNKMIDLGNLPPNEKRTVSFEIKNAGESPLVILDITTTSGCVNSSCPKTPIPPGETAIIEVVAEKKETGFFEETLAVKYNIKRRSDSK